MIDLKNRVILDDGTVLCTESAAIDILYKGLDLSDVILNNESLASEFNRANKLLDQGFEFLSSGDGPQYENINWYDSWLTPQEYKEIDVQNYCLERCKTQEQRDRVIFEMQLFIERQMIPVIRHLIWMVDHMRKNKILWGVGRGSMTSSYVLFLIGINRIDSIKYNLDIKEFLR
jgi:DNA polymerase III alpha subunit